MKPDAVKGQWFPLLFTQAISIGTTPLGIFIEKFPILNPQQMLGQQKEE
ncbi:Hypothetical protein EAG7_03552 [Klebsiella aerogenes]|nr:Hypothetical protein EAG7_03552 [Klebsiella aerogenes]CCG32046.1 hypothetical protein [Klebsiella aerogenes EA1509E]